MICNIILNGAVAKRKPLLLNATSLLYWKAVAEHMEIESKMLITLLRKQLLLTSN
jgi:hypothetical protein